MSEGKKEGGVRGFLRKVFHPDGEEDNKSIAQPTVVPTSPQAEAADPIASKPIASKPIASPPKVNIIMPAPQVAPAAPVKQNKPKPPMPTPNPPQMPPPPESQFSFQAEYDGEAMYARRIPIIKDESTDR